MDRLSIFLTFMTGSALVGGLVTAVLSLGYYNISHIAGAAALGLFLTWPAAYAISRLIKRNDPEWRPRGGGRAKSERPRSDFPET